MNDRPTEKPRAAATVNGLVAQGDLGSVLSHEHLLFDFTALAPKPADASEEALFDAELGIERLGFLRFNPLRMRSNLVNTDETLTSEELGLAGKAGIRTVVDATNQTMGRDPHALVRISEKSGLNVIMSTGYYIEPSIGERVADRSIDDLAGELIRDIEEGVGSSGVRAGVIGEIGTSSPITPREERSLRAAAIAQAHTGAPLLVHLDGWAREAERVLDIIEAEGADLRRSALCHMNPSWDDPGYQLRLAERGAYLQFDMLGNNLVYPGERTKPSPNENDAIAAMALLLESGHGAQILISQDVYVRMMFQRFGGHGYSHIVENLQPLFRQHGFSDTDFSMLMVDNPGRLLAYLPG